MATVEDVVVAALARCGDLGIPTGGTRSVMYRRASIRQQQLFSEVAKRNPEYFGQVALGTLVNGAVNIDTMVLSNVTECEAVYRIEVGAQTTPTPPAVDLYATDQKVSLVSVNDPNAGLAPRVTIQNRVIRQVGTDLATVTKVRVYYSTRPAMMTAATSAVELPSPFEEVLVIDLAIWLIKQSAEVNDARKAVVLPALVGEQKEMETALLEHVLSFVSAFEGRFGSLR